MYTGSFLQSTSETLSKREELAMAEQTNALLSAVPSTTGTTCTIIHPLQKLVAVAKLRIYGDSARIYYRDLHEKMGHPSVKQMIAAVRAEHPAWKGCLLTEGQIRRYSKELPCPACILAKTKPRTPINEPDPADFPTSEGGKRSGNAEPDEILSLDPVGIINSAASNGHKYFWIVKDLATGSGTNRLILRFLCCAMLLCLSRAIMLRFYTGKLRYRKGVNVSVILLLYFSDSIFLR